MSGWRIKSGALAAVLIATLAMSAVAQSGQGQVSMIVTGGQAGPENRITMPLDNGGDPAVKVALAKIRVGGDAMSARLTTKLGVLSFESDAPKGVGDRPAVRSASFFDSAGGAFELGDAPAELTVESYAPGGAISFVFYARMTGATDKNVTVQALAPLTEN